MLYIVIYVTTGSRLYTPPPRSIWLFGARHVHVLNLDTADLET